MNFTLFQWVSENGRTTRRKPLRTATKFRSRGRAWHSRLPASVGADLGRIYCTDFGGALGNLASPGSATPVTLSAIQRLIFYAFSGGRPPAGLSLKKMLFINVLEVSINYYHSFSKE